jgi:hypothetical protein
VPDGVEEIDQLEGFAQIRVGAELTGFVGSLPIGGNDEHRHRRARELADTIRNPAAAPER